MVKDRKSSTITLLLENRKPLRQPNLIQPSSFSPIPPPKTTTIQPLSMQTKLQTQPPSPHLTPFLLLLPVYLPPMSTSFFPTTPLCQCAVLKPAQKRCMGISRQKRLLPPPLWSQSSPTFNFSSSSMKDIPPPIDIAIYDGSDSLLIAGSIQTQLLCVPFHIKCICQ